MKDLVGADQPAPSTVARCMALCVVLFSAAHAGAAQSSLPEDPADGSEATPSSLETNIAQGEAVNDAAATTQAEFDATTEYEKAQVAFDDMEYTMASTILMTIITSPTATEVQRRQAHLLNGRVLRIMGKDVEARLSFIYVLKHDPSIALPDDAAPKVKSFYELVRQEVLATTAAQQARESTSNQLNTGNLVFGSSPSDLSVRINDGDPMRTPFFQNLEPGKYRVQIDVPGEPPIAFVTDVQQGLTHKVKVDLWRSRDHTEQELSERNLKTSVFYGTSSFKCCTGISIGPSCCFIAACFSPGLLALQLMAGNDTESPIGIGPDNYLDLGILVFNVIANGCVGTSGIALLGWGVYDVVTGPPELEPVFQHVVVQTSSDADTEDVIETYPALFPPKQQSMEF